MKSIPLLTILIGVAFCHEPFKVIFQWNTIDVVWPSEEEKQFAITHGHYIPENNFIAGIKLWKNKMYLTVPRWKDGVPVTLGVTSATPVNRDTAPKLEAFPSWEMQKVGDCSAFQLVQSMEIDPIGRMWVIDTGRPTSPSIDAKTSCPPRLVILDLENDGEILRTYVFPANVARPRSAYLNDIVLDHEDGGMAYITDSDPEFPGIIVYSLMNNTSWKIRHNSMRATLDRINPVGFAVSKTTVNLPIHVNGIALSPANATDRQIYYSPLSSYHLYSIPTSVVKSNISNVDPYVKELGRKNSTTDSMMMSSTGVLYFGLLNADAVATWDTKQSASFVIGQKVISRDHERMQWPDTFAFDEDGYFYCVTNSLQNILNGRLDVNAPNYRVVRTKAAAKSYQYYEDGTAPEQPGIPVSGASSISLTLASSVALTGLVVLSTFVAV